MPIFEAHALRFAYPGEAPLLRDVSLAIEAGVTLLHGDTGSGKSTLLRIFAGALPASGVLTLANVRLDQDRAAYERHVFWCEPTTDRFDQLDVRAVTAALSAGDASFDAAQWQTLVDGFALGPHLAKPMYMLSTGSKRKVWLSAALASGRALVLLDEPAGGLDAASRVCLWRALARPRSVQAVVLASAERIEQLPLRATIELPLR
jgi:ABC-type multidrug transport system ATPase subunit